MKLGEGRPRFNGQASLCGAPCQLLVVQENPFFREGTTAQGKSTKLCSEGPQIQYLAATGRDGKDPSEITASQCTADQGYHTHFIQ